jgi:hypothetical protein
MNYREGQSCETTRAQCRPRYVAALRTLVA